MGQVEEIVTRISGAVFAVDESLRVVAWNRKAEEGLGLTASEVVGRPCYEVVHAVDVETGLPCYEQCPLVAGSTQYGWASSRVLRTPWSRGGRHTRLDCFLLKCRFPTWQQVNICFVSPLTASIMEAHSRVLETIEAIHPVVSGISDPRETLAVSLRAVLRTTAADAGELLLLDPETDHWVLMAQQGLAGKEVRDFCRSAIGEEFPDLFAHSQVPLLAIGKSLEGALADASGWYLCAPLVAEGRVLGALGIASQRRDFDIATAARILFPLSVQLSVYLRWAYLAGDERSRAASERHPAKAARLQFRCLGPFQISLDGKPIPMARFQRLKALTALKFLVARRGRSVPRDVLTELLWPEADPAHASGNLRVVLHALRRALEPDLPKGEASSFVLSQGDMVYLAPSDQIWVDVEEFVQRARRAAELLLQGRIEDALAEYRRAASLHRGEYLEDEPYSDWCLFERERLKEMYLNILKQTAAILSQRGDVAEAIDTYRLALGVDEAREEIHRELIRALWQAGRRVEALHQYQICRRVLREEIGTEPAEETQNLYKAMLVGTS